MACRTAVTAGELLFTLVGFTLLYGALMVADVYLLAEVREGGRFGRGPARRPSRLAIEPARA